MFIFCLMLGWPVKCSFCVMLGWPVTHFIFVTDLSISLDGPKLIMFFWTMWQHSTECTLQAKFWQTEAVIGCGISFLWRRRLWIDQWAASVCAGARCTSDASGCWWCGCRWVLYWPHQRHHGLHWISPNGHCKSYCHWCSHCCFVSSVASATGTLSGL